MPAGRELPVPGSPPGGRPTGVWLIKTNQSRVTPIWPPGFVAVPSKGTIVLKDAGGQTVAAVGDKVDLAGSESQDGSTFSVCLINGIPYG